MEAVASVLGAVGIKMAPNSSQLAEALLSYSQKLGAGAKLDIQKMEESRTRVQGLIGELFSTLGIDLGAPMTPKEADAQRVKRQDLNLPNKPLDAYNQFKKAYGETNAKIIRSNMPSALEFPDLFQNFVNEKIAIKEQIGDIIESIPTQIETDFLTFAGKLKTKDDTTSRESIGALFENSGFVFYETETEQEVLAFKSDYKQADVICTFDNLQGRLTNSHIFWIRRKGFETILPASEVTLEYLKEDTVGSNLWMDYLRQQGMQSLQELNTLLPLLPSREDPYGTSSLSVQIKKDNKRLKVINRYNHKVDNPDYTYEANLDNIINGLDEAIYNLPKVGGKAEVLDSNKANQVLKGVDGKYFFSEYSTGLFHVSRYGYIPKSGMSLYDYKAIPIDKSSEKIIGDYLINSKTRIIKPLFSVEWEADSAIRRINSIQFSKDSVFIETTDGSIKLGNINKEGGPESIEGDITYIGDSFGRFLRRTQNLDYIDLPNVEYIGNDFGTQNIRQFSPIKSKFELLSFPSLKRVGDNFLTNTLKKGTYLKLNFPSLEIARRGFLSGIISNDSVLSFPKLESANINSILQQFNPLKTKSLFIPNLELLSSDRSSVASNVQSISIESVVNNELFSALNKTKESLLREPDSLEIYLRYYSNTPTIKILSSFFELDIRPFLYTNGQGVTVFNSKGEYFDPSPLIEAFDIKGEEFSSKFTPNEFPSVEVAPSEEAVIDSLSGDAPAGPIGEPQLIRKPPKAQGIIKVKDKYSLSNVNNKNVIDIDKLIDDIIANNSKVMFWSGDQLGVGDYTDPYTGKVYDLQGGPSYMLIPDNLKRNVVWATGGSADAFTKRVKRDNIDYVFIISGSPIGMMFFNKLVNDIWVDRAIEGFGTIDSFKEAFGKINKGKKFEAINQYASWDDLKADLSNKKTFKKAKDAIKGIAELKTKSAIPFLTEYGLGIANFDGIRDGYFKENDFNLLDVTTIYKPTGGLKGESNHRTYANAIVGEAVGIPNRRVSAKDIMTQEFLSAKTKKGLTRESLKDSQLAKAIAGETGMIQGVSRPKAQRITEASEELVKLFKNDKTPLTVNEAAEILKHVSSWKDWYDGISGLIEDEFDEYSADFMVFLFSSAVAANSASTVGTAMNNLDRLYNDIEIGSLPLVRKNYFQYILSKSVSSLKISEFIKAGFGDKKAKAIDMHIWSLINSLPNTKKSPTTKKQFDKAKAFIDSVADVLDWHPREVQAAMWAANMLRLGQKPGTYEEYIKKRLDKDYRKTIDGWRKKGIKPIFKVNKVGEIIEVEYAREIDRPYFEKELAKAEERISSRKSPKRQGIAKAQKVLSEKSSATTQVATTVGSYVKAANLIRDIDGDVLDYGAGLGLGTDAMSDTLNKTVDSYEPNPERWQGKRDVTYTDLDDIDKKYDAIVSLNVLNVVPKDIRDEIVIDIFDRLNINGKAVISTRKWSGDVNNATNSVPGPEDKSILITRRQKGEDVKVFQKGFDGNELVDYIKSILGDSANVVKNTTFGANGVIISKKSELTTEQKEQRQPKRQGISKAQGPLVPVVYNSLLQQSTRNADGTNTPPYTLQEWLTMMTPYLNAQTATAIYNGVVRNKPPFTAPSIQDAYDSSKKRMEAGKNKALFTWNNLKKYFIDRQAELKKAILASGMKNAYNYLVNKAGSGARAAYFYYEKEKDIYKDLKKEQIEKLDQIIMLRRIIEIDSNFDERDEARPKHTNGFNKEYAEMELARLQKELGNAAYNDLNDRATKYFDAFRSLLDSMYDEGLVSEELYEQLRDIDYQPRLFLDHVFEMDEPSMREMNLSAAQIKRIKEGSEGDIMFDSRFLLALYAKSAFSKIARNKANKEIAKATDAQGNESWVSKTDKPGFSEVTYFEDGVKKSFYLKDNLKSELDDISRVSGMPQNIQKLIGMVTGSFAVKLLATRANPLFVAKNVPRDYLHVLFFTKAYDNMSLPLAAMRLAGDFIKGVKSKLQDDQDFKDFVEFGGGMDFLSTEGMESMITNRTVTNKIIEKLGKAGELSEIGFRLAMYKKFKEDGMKALGPNATEDEVTRVKVQAVTQAREMIDFSQGGIATKNLEIVSPYINSAFQGFRVSTSYIQNNPKEFAKKLGYLSIGVMMLALYNAMLGDDDMEDIPEETKRKYFIIMTPFTFEEDGKTKRHYVKIAKTQQLAPFIAGLELTSDYFVAGVMGRKPRESKDAYEYAWKGAAMYFPKDPSNIKKEISSSVPLFAAIAAYDMNYDTYRERAVSMDYNQVLPQDEDFTNKQVPYFYKALAQGIGASGGEAGPKRLQVATEKFVTTPYSSLLTMGAYTILDSFSRLFELKGPGGIPVKDQAAISNSVSKSLGISVSKVFTGATEPDWRSYTRKEEIDRINMEEKSERRGIKIAAQNIGQKYFEASNAKDSKAMSEAKSEYQDELMRIKKESGVPDAKYFMDAFQQARKYGKATNPEYNDISYAASNEAKARIIMEYGGRTMSRKELVDYIIDYKRKTGKPINGSEILREYQKETGYGK